MNVLLLNFTFNKQELESIVSINWYQHLSQYGVGSLKVLPTKLEVYNSLSQFALIPICNLPSILEVAVVRTIDVLFARELDKNFCVWWYSKLNHPDLGTKKISGIEKETVFSK